MGKFFYLPDYPAQPISFSVWQKIVNASDHGQAERVLYRAWRHRPKKVVPWIIAGLRQGYIWNAHEEEANSPVQVQAWIAKNLRGVPEDGNFKQDGGPKSMRELINSYGPGAGKTNGNIWSRK